MSPSPSPNLKEWIVVLSVVITLLCTLGSIGIIAIILGNYVLSWMGR